MPMLVLRVPIVSPEFEVVLPVEALLAEVGFAPDETPKIYACGPTAFVEDVSSFLVELGHDPLTVKTERFGPSGG